MLIIITKNSKHKRVLKKFLYRVTTNVYTGKLTVREKQNLIFLLKNISPLFSIMEMSNDFNKLSIGEKKENFLNKLVDFCME